MLTSIALILMLGWISGWLCKKAKIPSLLGMLLMGILLGPHVLNWLDGSILENSSSIRQIALIIILARAGISLRIQDLLKIGRSAILMCFVPATVEWFGCILLAPVFLHTSLLESALIGSVLAAVSPAVVVPKMIRLMEEGYGIDRGIPQLILAGASVDDVYVIVLFSSCLNMIQGGSVQIYDFLMIPVSIILGCMIGFISGIMYTKIFKMIKTTVTVQTLMILCIAFVLVSFQDISCIPYSGLLATMALAMYVGQSWKEDSFKISNQFNQLWVGAEIFLFVLVGALVDVKFAFSAGVSVVVFILVILVFRMIGVALCLVKTSLSWKERLFCMLAYTPKATVQAAIGGVPLSLGLACGNIVLTVAVVAIMVCAPIGAFAIERTYTKCLTVCNEN